MSAANDLLQLQQHPTYYDHIHKVEAAMAAQAETDRLRIDEFKWEYDEEQMLAPDPIHPGEQMPEDKWTDTTGLPLPEDMKPDDHLLLECMELFGKAADEYDGIAEVFAFLRKQAVLGWTHR